MDPCPLARYTFDADADADGIPALSGATALAPSPEAIRS
jgi:hypothetical protein